MKKKDRTIYLLMMDDYQQKELRIITEQDYPESKIKKEYPDAYVFCKYLVRKGDKITFHSPFNQLQIVVELIEY